MKLLCVLFILVGLFLTVVGYVDSVGNLADAQTVQDTNIADVSAIFTGNITVLGINGLVFESYQNFNSLRAGWNSGTNSTGLYNVLFGLNSGANLTTGNGNHLYGASAGAGITTGTYNSAFGDGSLWTTGSMTGSFNSGYGSHSLRSITTGSWNTAMGSEALYSLTSGKNNLGVGFQSGYSLVNGNYNIFVGNQAGYRETGSNRLYITPSGTSPTDSFIYGEMFGFPTRLWLNAVAADAVNPLASVVFNIRAHQWNGNSRDWNFYIAHNMTAAGVSPGSNVTMSIQNIPGFQIESLNGTVGVFVSVNGTMQKVYKGSANSAGIGYSVLMVAN